MKNINIYKLIDPITNEIRYVGKTKNVLSKRYNEHIYRAKQGHDSHVYCWIRKLLKNKMKKLKPIHKFNSGMGGTLCNCCRKIISIGFTEDLYCSKECKTKHKSK
jgi:hypothetical protein